MARYSVLWSLVLFATHLTLLPAVGMQQEDSYMLGRVVVQFKEGVVPVTGHAKTGLNSFDAVASPFGIYRIQQAFPIIEAAAAKRALSPAARELRRMYYVEYSGPFDPREVVSGLLRSKEVERAEPHFTYELAGDVSEVAIRDNYSAGRAVPNDTHYDDQTHLNRMEMEAAWDVVKGEDGNVVIAIVDGGTDWRHPDLRDNVWVNADEIPDNGIDDDNNGYVDDVHGWNFSNESGDPTGEPGTWRALRGTAVAGVAAAVTNNGIGIVAPSWNATYMPVNVSCKDSESLCVPGRGTVYAAENGADIILAAYSGGIDAYLVRIAMQFAFERGAVVVADAANMVGGNVDEKPIYPASYPTTLSVGGTQKDSDRALGWAFGRSIDVFAPAKDIHVTTNVATSLFPSRYGTMSGPYLAVALVAGVAALVRTQWPDYGVYEVIEQIRQTADNIDDAQPIELQGLTGRGRINARRAVTEDPTPGIRMVNFDWKDADGDGNPAPGESFTVEADFVNYGGDASALRVGLGVGNSTPYVTVKSPMTAVGVVPRLGTFSASFDLQVNDPSPDHAMVFYVTVEDGEFRSVADHFRILTSKEVHTLTTSKLVTSVNDNGDMNLSHLWWEYGQLISGFNFLDKKGYFLPALYGGGLIIGYPNLGSHGHPGFVGGRLGRAEDHSTGNDGRFRVVPGGDLTRQEGATTGWLRVKMQYQRDRGANRVPSMHLVQDIFVDDTPEHEDFLVLRYAVTNTDILWHEDMWIGLFLDWDVNPYDQSDAGRYNEGNQVAMVFDDEYEFGGVGVKVLSSSPQISFDLISHGTEELNSSSTEWSYTRWEALSGGIGDVDWAGQDLIQMVGAGPFNLRPQETVVVGFALIGGHEESDIVESAARAQLLWDNQLSVNAVANEAGVIPAQFDFAPVYPNPGNGRYSLSFTLPDAADVELVIYNALSQEVRALLQESRSAGAHTVEWNGVDDAGAGVASGVYFARLVARGVKGRMTRSQPLVLVR